MRHFTAGGCAGLPLTQGRWIRFVAKIHLGDPLPLADDPLHGGLRPADVVANLPEVSRELLNAFRQKLYISGEPAYLALDQGRLLADLLFDVEHAHRCEKCVQRVW